MKVEVEELEGPLGPEDVDVDFRRILKEATDEGGCEIFETFRSNGLSEFLMDDLSRWDKYKRKWNAPWRQNSSASASEGWWQEGQERPRVGGVRWKKGVMEAVDDYLDNCAHVKVDIEVLESLLKPENQEVSLRYFLKCSTRKTIFSGSSTHQRSRTTSWQAEDDGWKVKEKW